MEKLFRNSQKTNTTFNGTNQIRHTHISTVPSGFQLNGTETMPITVLQELKILLTRRAQLRKCVLQI